jgi:hypothetical protein
MRMVDASMDGEEDVILHQSLYVHGLTLDIRFWVGRAVT